MGVAFWAAASLTMDRVAGGAGQVLPLRDAAQLLLQVEGEGVGQLS